MNDNHGPRCNINEYGETMSRTRVEEYLDYATNYGEFNQNTPIGTVSKDYPDCIMTAERLGAIVAYMRVLGYLYRPV
jgi:hypothetical protein